MGVYKIAVESGSKTMEIKLGGTFSLEDIATFVKEFQANLAKIKPSEFHLTFDATEWKTLPQKMVPALAECFEIYKALKFKKISINMESPVAKLQISRIAKQVGLAHEMA